MQTTKAAMSNPAPEGTKIWLLDLGTLETDAGWVLKAGNTSTKSNPDGPAKHDRRKLAMYAVLIDHPKEGLILFETGPGPGKTGTDDDYEKEWGPSGAAEVFCRVLPDPNNELDVAIKRSGHDIKDVKHIVFGHLHLDHAGGLAFFKGRTDVTVWCHEDELKHAYWGVATKADTAYLPHYLDIHLPWRTLTGEKCDLFPGVTLVHLPGHTPGLMGLQIELARDGPFLFTSDHFHIIENYTNTHIQGWLARDSDAWYRSTEKVKRIENNTGARIIPGHDYDMIHNLFNELSKGDNCFQ